MLCSEVITGRELTYLGDNMCSCGGCHAAVTVITRFLWVRCMKCDDFEYKIRFWLMVKWTVFHLVR